jgi:hypothetical protein
MSGGRETFIPPRFLCGLIPDALLEAYSFWQDESDAPLNMTRADASDSTRGYKRLCGYPVDDEGEYLVFVEIIHHGNWSTYKPHTDMKNDDTVVQCTEFPGSTVKVTRRPKVLCDKDYQQRKRIAAIVEATGLLISPKAKGSSIDDPESGEVRFKVDEMVECDYEGKGDFWACVVRRVNDNETYDIEYINVKNLF